MHFQITGIQRQILISAVLYLGQIIAGFTVSWPGPIFPKLRDLSQSPLSEMPSNTQISLIASLILVGSLPGPYLTGWLSNIKGRKLCLILASILSCLSSAVLTFANNFAMVYFGRLIAGLGLGMVTVMNMVYLGEIASSNIRGMLLTGLGVSTTIGLVVMYSVGPFLSYTIATSIILTASIVFMFCTLFIPESPIFYVLLGIFHAKSFLDKEDLVREHLKDLGRSDDIDKILESKNKYTNSTSKKDWIELATIRSNRKALLIAVVLFSAQQCSGFYSVLAFSATIFEMAGSSINSDIAMVIVSLFQLCGSTGALFLVERYGRKLLLTLSSISCCLSTLLLAVYFYLESINYSGLNYVNWLPLVLIVVFFFGFDIGLGVVPNVLTGELFTTNVRSKGSGVASTIAWVIGFLVMTMYGVMPRVHMAFWFFSLSCFISFLFTLFCVPETKGKSLLEVQELLN